MVGLRVNRRTVRVLVHRIVCTVFHGQAPSPKHEARHLDGNAQNNQADNLAWGTHAENMADMVRHGTQGMRLHPERVKRGDAHWARQRPELILRGAKCGNAKVGEAQVCAIREVYAQTSNISETARRLRVPRGVAKCVIQGKTWKHVAQSGAGMQDHPLMNGDEHGRRA